VPIVVIPFIILLFKGIHRHYTPRRARHQDARGVSP